MLPLTPNHIYGKMVIVAGTSGSWGTNTADVLLLRIDSEGNLLWFQTYGRSESNWRDSVDIISDGGYIITGLTGTSDCHTFDIYLFRVVESHTRVDDSVKNSSTPKSLHLYQNSPNPFNPSTTTQYEIPAGSGLVSEVAWSEC